MRTPLFKVIWDEVIARCCAQTTSTKADTSGTIAPMSLVCSLADKTALFAQLVADLERDLAAMVQAARATHEAATHPEAKPENDKDTRGLELGYLAAGQSARASEQQRALTALRAMVPRAFSPTEAADVSAVVTIVDDDTDVVSHSLLAPLGGGQRLSIRGVPVQVVSPGAPLGKALLGKRAGDSVELVIGGKPRSFSVRAVQ
jgi:transcription elongation GreA/GreB family factor